MFGASLPCRRAQPEVCKERGSACASIMCLGTFFPGYAWTNKPCLLNPANSNPSCILPCFRALFGVCLPAQAHPERDSAFCQLLMLSGESWPRTQRKGDEEWGLEPGSQPSTLCLWLKAWITTTKVVFLPEKALWLQTCCGLSGLLEEDVLPGSQPDSFSFAWGKEGKSTSASELVLCSKCSLSYTGWFFPGKFSRPTPKGGVSRKRTFNWSAGGKNLASAVSQGIREGATYPVYYLHVFWSQIAPTSAGIPTSKNLYFCLFYSFLILKSQRLDSSLDYANWSENHLQEKSSRITLEWWQSKSLRQRRLIYNLQVI